MSVKRSDLADLIATTLADLPQQEFEVEWTNQDYEFSRIYQEDKIVIDGGTQIQRNVVLDHSGAARYRRLYDTDEPTVNQVQKQITVPWTQISTDYSWDELEILNNKNNAKGFVNLMKSRRIDGKWSLADLIEDRGWMTPTSATDDLYPYGVSYYLNLANNAVESSGDFIGQTIRYQNATTGTTCAGLDAGDSDFAKWRNYAFTYENVDNLFLKRVRKAAIKTQFKAPVFINDPADKRSLQKRIYAKSDTVVALQELLDAKDDNHGSEELMGGVISRTQSSVFLNGIPVIFIPQLDDGSDPSVAFDPIYCVDFSKFIPIVHDGYWMKEGEPMTDRGQHTTFTVFLDGSHNNLVTSRRKLGWVGHKVTS